VEITKLKFWGSVLLAFLIGWSLSFFVHRQSVKLDDSIFDSNKSSLHSPKTVQNLDNNALVSVSEIPDYAIETLEYILEYGEAPTGYVGGRSFQNREGLLPKKTKNEHRLNYREWDVHPRQSGKNRGAERLVTSQLGDAYFTADHYKSFKKIK
jgi:ribonuclease T1